MVFRLCDAFNDMPIQVPCGRCTGCRLEKSRQWAMRCVHEASLYDENCFITLTYADEYLPPGGTLVKKHFQKFMKRLRAKYHGTPIRFYHCGEYGAQSSRPHYHSILFGFDFPDKEFSNIRGAHKVYNSSSLEKLWPYGLSEIGSVTFESAAYVARYVTKKYNNKDPEKVKAYYDGRLPEYATMSRRPGIGKKWFDEHGKEVYEHDSVIINAKEVRPPKYYDMLMEDIDQKKMAILKRKRQNAIKEEEQTTTKLITKTKILESRTSLYENRSI